MSIRLKGKQLDGINAAIKAGDLKAVNAEIQKAATQAEGSAPLAVAPSSVAWFAAAQHLREGAVKLRKTFHTCAARDNLKTAKLCDEIAWLLKKDNL